MNIYRVWSRRQHSEYFLWRWKNGLENPKCIWDVRWAMYERWIYIYIQTKLTKFSETHTHTATEKEGEKKRQGKKIEYMVYIMLYNGSHFVEHRNHLNGEIMEFTKRTESIYCACRKSILLQNVTYDSMAILHSAHASIVATLTRYEATNIISKQKSQKNRRKYE